MMNELSEFEEMYLKCMWELHSEKPDNIVKTTVLAESMGVSPASTTEMIQRLSSRELVTYIPYRGSRLTSEGFSIAARIKRRQYLLEILLSDIIGFTGDANLAACRLEHSIDDELEASIDRLLGYPNRTLSGHRIPVVEREVRPFERNILLPIANIPEGNIGSVEIIAVNGPEAITLEKIGLSIGSSVEKTQGNLLLNGKPILISESLQKRILIRTEMV